jgi:hypothetical protein
LKLHIEELQKTCQEKAYEFYIQNVKSAFIGSRNIKSIERVFEKIFDKESQGTVFNPAMLLRKVNSAIIDFAEKSGNSNAEIESELFEETKPCFVNCFEEFINGQNESPMFKLDNCIEEATNKNIDESHHILYDESHINTFSIKPQETNTQQLTLETYEYQHSITQESVQTKQKKSTKKQKSSNQQTPSSTTKKPVIPFLKLFNPLINKRENFDKKLIRHFRKFLKVKFSKSDVHDNLELDNSYFWRSLTKDEFFPPMTYVDTLQNIAQEFKSVNTTFLIFLFTKNNSIRLYQEFISKESENMVNRIIRANQKEYEGLCKDEKLRVKVEIEYYVNNFARIYNVKVEGEIKVESFNMKYVEKFDPMSMYNGHQCELNQMSHDKK